MVSWFACRQPAAGTEASADGHDAALDLSANLWKLYSELGLAGKQPIDMQMLEMILGSMVEREWREGADPSRPGVVYFVDIVPPHKSAWQRPSVQDWLSSLFSSARLGRARKEQGGSTDKTANPLVPTHDLGPPPAPPPPPELASIFPPRLAAPPPTWTQPAC